MTYPTTDTKEIKKVLGGAGYVREWNKFDRQSRLFYFLQDIDKRIMWGFIDKSYVNISAGVAWVVGTGRIDALVLGWVHGRTLNELLDLLQELHANCTTLLEVMFYLNKIQIEYLGCGEDMHPIYKRVKKENGNETGNRKS